MSKQRRKICLVIAAVILILAGALIYTEVLHDGDKMPGGVFVSL